MPLTKTQSGFTLLEILVAIVVLSLGLLGLAGLQAASLNNNQTAYYRGIATQQAYDIADRLRANLAGAGSLHGYSYNNLTAGLPVGNPDCFATSCTPENMAIFDHRQWNTANATLLPNGNGTVVCADGPAAAGCTAATGNWVFNITVMWTEKGAGGDCPLGSPANLRCFMTSMTP
ncbi:Type IV pilus assembly protein PilV [Candidatus Nitrotoga sp. HW29]|uniref:type IV pilus modification protein PilV n=1 Tax=Candidatus Nitrotoga sp. HW29 TaxID=2886963 RepID=UPI001EF23539|nr:type IV pilus modification protein PilV [Candidatus Nitrotoga sp. HW29]CAH1903696.1 Type IV pilus assembly protein PilV [Candidatus Nitrotoga sp. HW29]